MSLVKVSIDIDAPPDEVYDFVMDPQHFDEWVTIHRKLNQADEGRPHEGYQLQQTLHLRGANFKVRWTLTECDRPRHATFEGRGPARSYARTSYALEARNGGGTRFDYENEFKAPGGPLGAVASRALIGGLPEREANASLKRLKSLLESR
jgi:carbon monoxide dehydrogenase subunit G